jgi:ABC-type multidrug transport system permease subunit
MVGRSLADCTLTLWGLLIAGVLGVIVGFRGDANAAEFLTALALLVFSAYCFTWVFIAVGLTSKSAQAANGTCTLIVVPLSFISAAYVPADSLPGWLQPVANHQPFTVLSNALRSLTLGGAESLGLGHSTAYWVMLSVIWFAGIFVVFSFLSVRRFSRRR